MLPGNEKGGGQEGLDKSNQTKLARNHYHRVKKEMTNKENLELYYSLGGECRGEAER